MEEKIGKKVRLIKNEKMLDSLYEIVKVLNRDEVNDDWCLHYIIKDSQGNEQEIREVDCVIAPEDSIEKYLSDNGVYVDSLNEFIARGLKVVDLRIEWGDWKREHAWCEQLMRYIGYARIDFIVTEENGSDCYSAIHRYANL